MAGSPICPMRRSWRSWYPFAPSALLRPLPVLPLNCTSIFEFELLSNSWQIVQVHTPWRLPPGQVCPGRRCRGVLRCSRGTLRRECYASLERAKQAKADEVYTYLIYEQPQIIWTVYGMLSENTSHNSAKLGTYANTSRMTWLASYYLPFRKGSRNEDQTHACILVDFDFPDRLSIHHSYTYHINRSINSILQ